MGRGPTQPIAQPLLGFLIIPVVWLHHEPVSAPSAGSHWSQVVGWDPATWQVIMHDPYGEARLVGVGYQTTAIGSGKGQRYSQKNWGQRY